MSMFVSCEAITFSVKFVFSRFYVLAIQVNRARIESVDSEDDTLERHHVEGAFVDTVL